MHEGVLEFLHFKRGWPRHYATIDRMPLETATVFTRLLHTEPEEGESDVMASLAEKMSELRESFG